MVIADLIAASRADELDDEAEPYLWSDSALLRYAVEAEQQAARRARLFVDSTTSAVCSIAVTGGSPLIVLDTRVIRVNRARWNTEPYPLCLRMLRDMDREAPGWQEETSTVPTHAVVDFQSGRLRLYPSPSVNGTVLLTAVRMPLLVPNDIDDALEIGDEHAAHLRHWIAYRAFSKRDNETYRPEAAADHLALFEREFGRIQPVYDEVWAQANYAEDSFNGRY